MIILDEEAKAVKLELTDNQPLRNSNKIMFTWDSQPNIFVYQSLGFVCSINNTFTMQGVLGKRVTSLFTTDLQTMARSIESHHIVNRR